jgi:hypothetical protein
MSETLTRENRYELVGSSVCIGDIDGQPVFANTVRCRSCGALLLAVDEDLHERLHPRVGCMRVHATLVHHPGGHAWEEQFG